MIETKILIGLHRVANLIDRETASLVLDYGLSLGQFAVLEALYHKGDLTIGAVQEKILSSTGTIPIIVGNLEKMDYIIRYKKDNDKRCTYLKLTSNGKKLISKIYPLNEKIIVNRVSLLTDREKELLLSLLLKLKEEKNE
ncbi:MAG: MarR family winged helix-turn-helix transcriptional regulator [Filifactoraceae bacterium]